ncbi:3D domain-containing protein [Bacillus paramycoides]|uniref:3D domain-containing protein n=1 Tax=Bacillus paramycoides TaxID=2026194 RepID=UPI002E1CCC66|nr:3D domain-containing protein [Bacillus paramycoides]MED0961218.1 3D domain-containing protein [Bacillus paramycoides]
MKKQIAVFTLVTTLGLSIQPIVSSAETAQNTQAAQQNGWVKDQNGTWFFYENGALKTGWLLHDGKWYYLNGDGALALGWIKVEDKWFYLDGNNGGALKVGWFKYNDNWFYLEESSSDPSKYGALKTGWLLHDGKWYYLEESSSDPSKYGSMKTGWVQVDSKWFYLDGNAGGAMVTGWNRIDGKMNYFKDNGQWNENTRELTVSATAYTNDPAENDVEPGQHVYTKMGDDLTANPNLKVIAVDPSVIPLESKVYVEGYGIAEARDTGGAIKGNKIDVFIPSKQESSNWGRKTVKIYVLPKN